MPFMPVVVTFVKKVMFLPGLGLLSGLFPVGLPCTPPPPFSGHLQLNLRWPVPSWFSSATSSRKELLETSGTGFLHV